MKKNKLIIAIPLLCAVLALLASISVAWYCLTNHATLQQINGAVTYLTKYFESGDGTGPGHATYDSDGNIVNEEGCAYEIKTPEQFYNLAWLQYMGYFNSPAEGSTEIPPVYFYLSADLDMSDYVLPPIGTSTNPFLGNLDGCGHTVSGLTVTNKVQTGDTPIKDLPYIMVMDGVDEVEDVQIIGLFGVVGTMDEETEPEQTSARFGDYTYSSQTNEIKDLYIDGITVKTQTSDSLIGIVAGYVNGTISGVGVVDSNVDVSNGAAALTDITANTSDYAIVGHCTEAYTDSMDVEFMDVAQLAARKSQYIASDSGDAWGGSIDMLSLHTRLSHIFDLAEGNNRYVSGETVHIDKADPDNPEKNYTETTATANNNKYYYYTANVNKNNGESAVGSEYNFTQDSKSYASSNGKYYHYICLSGPSNDTTKTVTTVEAKHYNDAFYLTDGSHYLSVNAGGTAIVNPAPTAQSNARAWLQDANGYLYTLSDNGTKYYLNANPALSVSTTASTKWTYSDGTFSYTVDGQTFSLCYDDDSGFFAAPLSYVLITDGSGHYLSAASTTAITSTAAGNASQWFWDGNKLFTYYNGTKTYLRVNNGTLSLNTNANNGTAWTKDGTALHNGENYIKFADNAWTCGANEDITYYYIHSGNNYLSINNNRDGLTNVTNQQNATRWVFSDSSTPSGTIYTIANGTKYYIYFRDSTFSWLVGGLTVTDNAGEAVSWKNDGNNLYYSTGARTYRYIRYNNGWTTSSTQAAALEFTTGETPYVPGNEQQVTNSPVTFNKQPTTIDTEETTKTQTGVRSGLDTYFPLTEASDNELAPHDSNTGYIVSGDYANTGNGDIRVSWYGMNYINTALNQDTYSPTRLQVLTQTATSNGLKRIDDDYNNVNNNVSNNLRGYSAMTVSQLGLQKYNDSRNQLEDMFNPENANGTRTASSYIYGLHFMQAQIDKSHLVTAPYVKINGTEYENFQLPQDSIDFTLKEKGYINFFAGSYYNNPNNTCFFSLHQIFRDGNQNITDIKEISEIYKHNTDADAPFVYKYADGTYSSGGSLPAQYSMVFQTSWIKNPTIVMNAVYYYEIPANEGEYALGSVNGGTGAYLFYLDISANKQTVDRVQTVEQFEVSETKATYPKGVQFLASGETYTADTDSAAFRIDSGTSGTIPFARTDNEMTAPDGTVTGVFDGGGNVALNVPLEANLDKAVRYTVTRIIDTDRNQTSKATTKQVTTITDTQNVRKVETKITAMAEGESSYSDVGTFTYTCSTTDKIYWTYIFFPGSKTYSMYFASNAGVTLTVAELADGYTMKVNGTAVAKGGTVDITADSTMAKDLIGQAVGDTAMAYHYAVPADADVTHVFDEPEVTYNPSVADTLIRDGETYADLTVAAVNYPNVTVSMTDTDEETTIYEDSIANTYSAKLNGGTFQKDTEVTLSAS